MKLAFPLLCVLAATGCPALGAADGGPETWRIPLSGEGPSDAVEWEFQVSAGRRAGERATIPVPSQWEQHGFGDYDYGTVAVGDKHKEDGIYQRSFLVPEAWRGRRVRIVFDGSMTDTTVTVNDQAAGPVHQGGFYRFHHEITGKVRFGAENRLQVLVSKDSANRTVEEAERHADYWVFGGIHRPVWLEARPPQSIEWTAVDARADGGFRAKVFLDGNGGADRVVARVLTTDGQMLGVPLEARVGPGLSVELSGRFSGVSPWSSETPRLHLVEFSLCEGARVLHRVTERTGFRTFEARRGQGVFINGTRVAIKGINRHCFRPASGRALDPKDSVEDVRLIKSMNMNAVRCSHYPPEKAFLDACDELGLYVIDELCTWQTPMLDTPTARRLVGQMIRRDVNHPSILWWANGNEGGWNREVDGDYAQWDIRQRPVLHPWEEFSGFQTKHYPTWERLQQDLAGPWLVMPTEFLHGLHDGGHGAGLEDYWNAITSRPNGVGGFLWVLADEGIKRTDRGGTIDTWGTNAPDGIVGPNHEKEASYWTAKDIFCPVQIAMRKLPVDFDGRIEVVNRHDFRNLTTCRFRWALRDFAEPAAKGVAGGELPGPDVAPGGKGALVIPLPVDWRERDCLELSAFGQDGEELWVWSWPVRTAGEASAAALAGEALAAKVDFREVDGGKWRIKASGCEYIFGRSSGTLLQAKAGGRTMPLANGPRLVGGEGEKPEPRSGSADPKVRQDLTAAGACRIEVVAGGPFESFAWTVQPDGRLDLEYRYRIQHPTPFHGITFDLPEASLLGFSWHGQGPERVWANRMRGTRFGSFEREFRKLRPGMDFDYPHAAGFYAGVRQAELRVKDGTIGVICHQDDTFLRIGTNDEGGPLRVSWPEGDFSLLHAIPAIGNKFHRPEETGPSGEVHPAPGAVGGKVSFRFGN